MLVSRSKRRIQIRTEINAVMKGEKGCFQEREMVIVSSAVDMPKHKALVIGLRDEDESVTCQSRILGVLLE